MALFPICIGTSRLNVSLKKFMCTNQFKAYQCPNSYSYICVLLVILLDLDPLSSNYNTRVHFTTNQNIIPHSIPPPSPLSGNSLLAT